jgi:hypothetical protein
VAKDVKLFNGDVKLVGCHLADVSLDHAPEGREGLPETVHRLPEFF